MDKYLKTDGLEYLAAADKALGAFIAKRGLIMRRSGGDPFVYTVISIINQQIAGVVAKKICASLAEIAGGITPQNIAKLSEDELRQAGISARKAHSIKVLADAVISGKLDFEKLRRFADSDVIHELRQLPGIGVWTAEMILIFCFNRKDVFSYLDFGVLSGFRKIHPRADIKKYKRIYSPYGTTATLYCWELAAVDAAEKAAKRALK